MKFLFLNSVAALLQSPVCEKAPHKPNSTACAHFQEFEEKFQKTYKSDEDRSYRYYVFLENYVELTHMKETAKGASFSYLSPLFDWTPAEFKARNNLKVSALGPRKKVLGDAELKEANDEDSYDWRDHGAVNAIKDQGQCGSCWSFATVANIEGVFFHQHGKLWSLSEEELVNCDDHDNGCNGGLPANAANWMITNQAGLETETDYPYDAKDEKCEKQSSLGRVYVTEFQWVTSGREDLMAKALVKYGPLSVGINADPLVFYSGGIVQPNDENPCYSNWIDHGVAAVGFGSEDGVAFWTIRNSWGADWGEDGYFRLERGTGACGIDQLVTTVTATQGQEKDRLIVA